MVKLNKEEFNEKIFTRINALISDYDLYLKSGKNSLITEANNFENYEVKNADCFYFFNPFSIEILLHFAND